MVDFPKASPRVLNHFAGIVLEVNNAYEIAKKARVQGFDPETNVDIHLASTMAERVEGLISVVEPRIIGSGVASRILELEKKYGPQAWEVALEIAKEVSLGKFFPFQSVKEGMETGIRTGFAYHTVGIVSAPLEGFVELRIKKRHDQKEYIAMVFAGPVRGAGGTAASVCLLIGDYVREAHSYSEYDATDLEQERMITELFDYHERVTNLQYKPSEEEIKFLISKIPIEVDGEPTEELEVSNHKDVKRIETNRIRGGACLVLSMLALKAPKLWKEVSRMKLANWGFLKEFLDIQKQKKSGSKESKKLSPDFTYIADLVAGRPVLAYPLQNGGFRLRYGKTRVSGYSATAIHPSTMLVLDKYIATGTQLKLERPGKATVVTPCETIEPPIIKLKNGNVIRLDWHLATKGIMGEIAEIIYLGDILISYGDFFDRAHPLVPAGYCIEWYVLDIKKKESDLEIASKKCGVSIDVLEGKKIPNAIEAILVSKKLGIPLHPYYTYYFGSIKPSQVIELKEYIKQSKKSEYLILPLDDRKRILELLGVPHQVTAENIVIGIDDSIILNELLKNAVEAEISIDSINLGSEITIRDKAGTFIGARMGRPEKAKMRKMIGSPNGLFPVGEAGGRLKLIYTEKPIEADVSIYLCECGPTIYLKCHRCGKIASKRYFCKLCGIIDKPKCKHGFAKASNFIKIDSKEHIKLASKLIGMDSLPEIIKGVKNLTSKNKSAEHLSKAILRAKNEVYVNKDGTIRYDMTEMPMTHFIPSEIGTSIEKLRELGYLIDKEGNDLISEHQIVEILPQDMVLPRRQALLAEGADSVLFNVAKFVDEELEKLYGLEKYYNLEVSTDLIGHYVIGLAPHISAGMVGRIIGFSNTQAMFAHPLFHAALRRDADGDEASVILLMDALLNFSRSYLPDARGSRTMDAPLVLTQILNPSEVDDMVHRFDCASTYPLELYEKAQLLSNPWDVKVELLGARLNTDKQYDGIGYTHETAGIGIGVNYSAYKSLATMEEKLMGQMEIAEKVRAVNATDVATLVINKHFIKDIKGNLRRFATQQFRCVKCNTKVRRPPLMGRCPKCQDRLLFTVTRGSIVKYLEPAISLAEKYSVNTYTKQTLELTKRRIIQVFGKEDTKQEALKKWFG